MAIKKNTTTRYTPVTRSANIMIEQISASTQAAVTAATNATAAAVAATSAATHASENAAATASATALVSNDIAWMKKSLLGIEETLKELGGYYATKSELIEINRIQQDHENRTRSLEQSVWKFIGVSSVVSAIIGIVGSSVVGQFFK